MEDNFDLMEIVNGACDLPYVKINRTDFLRKQFSSPKYASVRSDIIKAGPPVAGIPKSDLKKLAESCIKLETTKVTALSAGAGIPGGFAIIGTVPADIIQFYGHVLRVLQELLYLYGWDDIGQIDDETKNMLVLFLGLMSGVSGVEKIIGDICMSVSNKAAKSLATKALTKTTYYPIIKKIAKAIGVRMTKEVFADSVAKAVPIVGAAVSGTVTFATFKPMCNRLLKTLDEKS